MHFGIRQIYTPTTYIYSIYYKNGSHYRASEVIPLILGVFKNKIERKGRQNKNKTLGRARDPRANGAWLNKLTE